MSSFTLKFKEILMNNYRYVKVGILESSWISSISKYSFIHLIKLIIIWLSS